MMAVYILQFPMHCYIIRSQKRFASSPKLEAHQIAAAVAATPAAYGFSGRVRRSTDLVALSRSPPCAFVCKCERNVRACCDPPTNYGSAVCALALANVALDDGGGCASPPSAATAAAAAATAATGRTVRCCTAPRELRIAQSAPSTSRRRLA